MFRSLRRLWKEGDNVEEARVKRILLKATIMDDDLQADMCRTRIEAWKTQVRFKQLFATYGLEIDKTKPDEYVPAVQYVQHSQTSL